MSLEDHARRLLENPEFRQTLEDEGEVTEPGRPAAMVLAPYISDDDTPWEEQVVPCYGYEDLAPLARSMLDILNEHRPGELTTLKGELYDFLEEVGR